MEKAPIEKITAWEIKCSECFRRTITEAEDEHRARTKFNNRGWHALGKKSLPEEDRVYRWKCPECYP